MLRISTGIVAGLIVAALVLPTPAITEPLSVDDQIIRIYEAIDALELKHQARFEALENNLDRVRGRLAVTRHRLESVRRRLCVRGIVFRRAGC